MQSMFVVLVRRDVGEPFDRKCAFMYNLFELDFICISNVK
jgi:hypothetical protein